LALTLVAEANLAGTKSVAAGLLPSALAKMMIMAAPFTVSADRGCLSMIAASLFLMVGSHFFSLSCRPGGRQMPVPLFANATLTE
jgi:hypothetical protein